MKDKPKLLSRAFFQQWGSVGGKAKAANMTPEQRKEIGRQLTEAKQKKRAERAAAHIQAPAADIQNLHS